MKRPSTWLRAGSAAPLLAVLCACDPELQSPHAWACSYSAAKKDSACTGHWYCARDNFCHDPDLGESVPCQKATVSADCATGWFCGLDSVCHDSDAGVQLLCEGDDDCGGGWHCGVLGHCYDRTSAGPVACRPDAGDCADTWRCGVDDVCHPATDAGAIACRYGVDSDCTDGWRCGAQGLCLDPAGEQLVLNAAMTGTPQQLDVGGPGGTPFFVGPLHSDGSQGVALGMNNAIAHWQKTSLMGTTFPVVQSPVPVPGVAPSKPVVVDESLGFGFDPTGKLLRWKVDAGTAVVTPLSVGHTVDSLRLLPLGPSTPGEAAAFLQGGDGVFLTQGAGQWVQLNGGPIVDVQGFPLTTDGQAACWLVGQKPNSGSPTINWSLYRGSTLLTCTAFSTMTAPVYPGDVRVGADGLVANVRRVGITFLDVYDFSPVAATCGAPMAPPICWSRSISCGSICGQGEDLLDFIPVRTQSGLGAEVVCGNADHQRRMLLSESPVQSGACTTSNQREASLAFELPLEPSAPPGGPYPLLAPGGFNRFFLRPSGGYDVYGGPSLSLAVPWFMDRTATFAAHLPFGFVFGDGSLLGAIDSTTAVYRPPSGASHIIGRVPGAPLVLTSDRIIAEIPTGNTPPGPTGFVDAPDTDWVDPIRSAVVPRAEGSSVLVVSASQTLYASPALDGGPQELPSVLVPSPGSSILSLARGHDAADAGVEVSLWVGTRQNVLSAYQTLAGRWHAQPLPIELPDDVVEVWSTADGRGRVGVANGQVLSLPSGLLLAGSPGMLTGQAQSFLELCGTPFVMDERYVYALRGTAQGTQWEVLLDAFPSTLLGGKLLDGTLLEADGGMTDPTLTVFGRYGDIWTVTLAGCGP